MSATEMEISIEPVLYRYVKLILFTIILIPGVLISIYILYQFVRNRQHRSRLNNHSIIALILISLIETTTELPITLEYLRLGHVQPMKYSFCLFWIWYNFSLQTINLSLMSWISIERHILIFHSHWVQTFIGKCKWHFLPLLLCVTYIPIFYFCCIILYRCANTFDYTSLLCGTICYNEVKWLSTFDWMTNILLPSLLILLASVSLLIRVLIQAKKMRRIVADWKSRRKMTLQLMIISLLYLIFYSPLALISLLRIYFLPNLVDDITYYYLYYTPYLVQLLMPFVSIACLPEMWPKENRIYPTFVRKNLNG